MAFRFALLRSLAAVFVLLLWTSPAFALYSSRDPVVLVNEKTFKREVLSSDVPVIVEFFAPWCGHCKNLAPTYVKVAKKVEGYVKVAAIDCDDQANRGVCGEYGIQGFPTIKLFKPKSNLPEDYNGPRTLGAISKAGIALIPNKVRKLIPDEATPKLKREVAVSRFMGSNKPRVVLVTDKSETPTMFKAIANKESYKGVVFAEVRKDMAEMVITALGLQDIKYPAVLLLQKGENAPVFYEGPLKRTGIEAFIEKHVINGRKENRDEL
ncbi:thioredoxin-like protein [Gaertneriomyces semiglobifer]|nr:thioredoxin-like protein [Gaertneriomyces semiglobifer]